MFCWLRYCQCDSDVSFLRRTLCLLLKMLICHGSLTKLSLPPLVPLLPSLFLQFLSLIFIPSLPQLPWSLISLFPLLSLYSLGLSSPPLALYSLGLSSSYFRFSPSYFLFSPSVLLVSHILIFSSYPLLPRSLFTLFCFVPLSPSVSQFIILPLYLHVLLNSFTLSACLFISSLSHI